MSGSLTKFGIGAESTYGTAVEVTVPFEIISEDFRGNYERLQAEALSGSYVDRADRFAVTNKGAAGSVELEPLTKGFGNWLAFMLGSADTVETVLGQVYTHTGTVGTLNGKSVTAQVLRADEEDVLQPWTYEGGKVTNFEFSNSVDQTLRCSVGLDFELESNPDAPVGVYTKAALDSLAVPAGAHIFNWQGGTIRVGGTVIDVEEISVSVDNALNVDRYFINQGAGKREPKQDGKREISWSFKTTYANNTFWKKVASATVDGAFATLEAVWSGPVLLGDETTYPELKIEIPVARFDEGGPVVEGPSALEQTFSGRGLFDGTASPITVSYVTADATVLGSA